MHNHITAERSSLSLIYLLFNCTNTLSMAKSSFFVWAAVLLPSSAFARPLFTGRLVSRADGLLNEYDYVIVGGGASGLTVANRLSEQPGMSTNGDPHQSTPTNIL